MADTEAAPPQEAKQVVYCGVCTLPPEYCEFGGTTKKCEEWLKAHHPDMHGQIYSADAIEANLSSLSIEAQQRAEKDAKKKAAKAESAAAKEAEMKAHSKVTIKRIERNKRKYVTAIIGLEAFGLDLKKVAKDLGKKFATGASVTKLPAGGEEITLQGDLSDDVFDFLIEKYDEVPEDNVECVEDKKKKSDS
ncbi:Translation initiation factor SUI1 [Lasiodiplodia theobromae]|uniref:Translation machinery-associated protein 22 n=2 Tax=Lasiodiplodia TaxID=66739 RepID=A0A5N5D8J3_9PEZI|nr:Translation machinery-associated protein 22 [Lasiodiplodia theobromae]KAF9633727.1 Translation initiation factor SUI1 [Lasiodiplodia theobromae]KAK0661009.1 Translation machinery-associated protein 22 [Lasiodiplodia hormozganensis]